MPAGEERASARHRRVAGQGEDDRGLPRRGLRRRGERRPHPRPARPRASCRRTRRRAASASSRSTSTTASSPTTSSTPTRRRRSPSSSGCSRTPTSSSSRRTRTARARPSPGTCSQVLEPKVPVRRMVFHEITRDAIREAVDEHPRPRPAPRRRPGDPADPRPAVRLRGQPGAVAQGARRACPPAACSPSRPGWSSSASGSASPSSPRRYWDLEATSLDPGALHARLVAVDGARVATGRDFDRDGRARRPRARSRLDEAGGTSLADRRSPTRPSPSAASRTSPTAARRRRRS